MINRSQSKKAPREEIYKIFLQKLFAGGDFTLAPLEIDILNEIKQNYYKWDTKKIAKTLNISIQQLTNYKGNLVKKGLILKNPVGDYVLNEVCHLPSNDKNEFQFRLIIDLFVIEDESKKEGMEEDNSGNILETPDTREYNRKYN